MKKLKEITQLKQEHNLTKGSQHLNPRVSQYLTPEQFAAPCWRYKLKTSDMKLKNQDKENTEECMLLLVGKVIRIMVVIQEPQGSVCVTVGTGMLWKINSKK